MVMRRDTLEVEELDVYNACIHWAEAECQRLHLEVDTCVIYVFNRSFSSRGQKK